MLCLNLYWIFLSLTVLIPLYFFSFYWTQLHTVFCCPAVTSAGPTLTHVVCITWRSRHWSLNLVSSLLPSSAHPHHRATSSTPKGGNNPHPRRTEQSTAGVHRPHMHPSHTGTLIYTPPGAIFRFSGSSASSAWLYVCSMCVLILQWAVQGLFTLSIQLCVCYWYT